MNTVHYGKRKLSLRKIFSETFVRCVLVPSEKRQSGADIEADLIIPKIHIVVPYLKVDPDQVDQRDVVTGGDLGAVPKKKGGSEHIGVVAGTGHHKFDGYAK